MGITSAQAAGLVVSSVRSEMMKTITDIISQSGRLVTISSAFPITFDNPDALKKKI